jgi:drug/metabolite transporter (DMT)-like permease
LLCAYIINKLQGIMCSGVAYYVQGIVIQERGPVFVTAFSPLCMIIVTVLGSFILSEVITLGRYLHLHVSYCQINPILCFLYDGY